MSIEQDRCLPDAVGTVAHLLSLREGVPEGSSGRTRCAHVAAMPAIAHSSALMLDRQPLVGELARTVRRTGLSNVRGNVRDLPSYDLGISQSSASRYRRSSRAPSRCDRPG
jgi:hypothetical protein